MRFFNKKKIEDEWIVHTKNKIYTEIYMIIIVIAAISLLVKTYYFNLAFSHIITEMIILFVGGVYYIIRSVYLGIYTAEIEIHDRESKWNVQKKSIVYAIIIGFGIALAFGLNSAIQYAEGWTQSVTYFFITFIVSIIIYLPLSFLFFVIGNELMKRKSNKIANEMLSDDSVGDDDEKS